MGIQRYMQHGDTNILFTFVAQVHSTFCTHQPQYIYKMITYILVAAVCFSKPYLIWNKGEEGFSQLIYNKNKSLGPIAFSPRVLHCFQITETPI
jgi:hypothetical protein